MSITLNGIPLPSSLVWAEEHGTRLRQSTRETLGGDVHIYHGRAGGFEPMTLEGLDGNAWATKQQLGALVGMLETESELLLTLHDGTSHTVLPREDAGRVVEWERVFPIHDLAASDHVRIIRINFWRVIQ